MGACSALGCKNRTTRNRGVSFHRFPKKKELQDAWVAAMRRGGWRPNNSSLLCSAHFREEDIDRTSLSCIRLRDNVVPSLFPGRKRRSFLDSSSLATPIEGDHCYGLPMPSDMDTSSEQSEYSEEPATPTAGQDDNSCSDLQSFSVVAASALELLHQGSILVDNDVSSEADLGRRMFKENITTSRESIPTSKENIPVPPRDQHAFPHLRPIAPKPVAAPKLSKKDACLQHSATGQQPAGAGATQVQVLATPGTARGVSLLKKNQNSGENVINASKPDGLVWGLQCIGAIGEAQEVIILNGVEVEEQNGVLQGVLDTQDHTPLQAPATQGQGTIPEQVYQMCVPRIVSVTGAGQCVSTTGFQHPVAGVQKPAGTTCDSVLNERIRILKAADRSPASRPSSAPNRPSDDDWKVELQRTIQKFRSLHNADRKKVKALQECVRRLRLQNAKLKRTASDLSVSLSMSKRELSKMNESQQKALTRYLGPPCCCCSEDT
ncbi:unnamed protein product [Ixodes hexagonus]